MTPTPVPTSLLRIVLVLVLAFGVVACGDDGDGDDTGSDPGVTAAESEGNADAGDAAASSGDGDESEGDSHGDAAPPPGGGGGELIVDGESIDLTSSQCYLQPQEAAAGGGTIEFVAQGFGTDKDGEPVNIDVSRYSEESDFAGDDVTVFFGTITDMEGTNRELLGRYDVGAVDVSDDTVGFEGGIEDTEAMETVTISFIIEC